MARTIRSILLTLAFSLATGAGTSGLSAQSQTIGESRRQSTRAELEKAAALSEEAAARATDAKLRQTHAHDAAVLRQRLKEGDFAPGDRILLKVYGDSVLSDTFTVRADRVLRLANVPDISLQGVLGSELEGYLTNALAVFFKEPRVDAIPLLRVLVQGAVGRPGYYVVPVDQALPDLITTAGLAGATSDLDRAVVRRGNATVLDRNAMRDALRQGKTVGDVSMRDGDEIFVPDRTSRFSATTVLGALSAAGGVIWALRWVF